MSKKTKVVPKQEDDPRKVEGLVDIEEGNINKIAQSLDTPLEISQVVEAANAVTIDDIIMKVNGKDSASHAIKSVFGTLIDQGKIGIIIWNGVVEIVGPGRYIIPNPRATLRNIASLTENPIIEETLTITRVQRGELGLAFDNGQPIVLGEGLHVRNSRLFVFKEFVTVNQNNLVHGSIHIIRVPKGSFALVNENTVPKLLGEGIHVANSNLLEFLGMQSANTPYLTHGTIHLMRVAKGSVALVTDNNIPKLIGEGTHFINSATFNYSGMESLNQQVIRHGTITRFRVLKGEVGLGWDNNEPIFFEEGVYEKDSPNFQFEGCVNSSDKQINLGAKKIITVWDGEIGISFLKGKLVVLAPNRHLIDSAEHFFQGFLSTQQQCLHLFHKKMDSSGEHILSCETKDFVEIGIKADIFYRIVEPEKVLLIVGQDNVIPLVRETSIATLNSIVRNTSLAQIAQNKEVTAKSQRNQPEGPEGQAKQPIFFDKVHDEFISKLHDSFIDRYGIEISNIRIESFKIINQELAKNISQQALVTTQTETQLTNLASQTEIAIAQQRRDADLARIKAEGDASKLKTETDAKNRATMETAKAQSESLLIQAKASSTAMELKADAEAKAILLKAEAEAKRADMLQKTQLGSQISMFQMYSDMVKNSLQDIPKVLYLPADAAHNPFSFDNLQTGSGNFNFLKQAEEKKFRS